MAQIIAQLSGELVKPGQGRLAELVGAARCSQDFEIWIGQHVASAPCTVS
jgi:hypothetical protein